MKKMFNRIIIYMLILFTVAVGKSKKEFDVQFTKKSQNSLQKFGTLRDGKIITGNFFEYTILNGGYFSLGTSENNSNHILAKNCQLTFGHPYALTSFIKIFNDGKWYTPIEDFELLDYSFSTNNDTLSLTFLDQNNYEVIFSIFENNSSTEIKLSVSVKNLSGEPENFNVAFVVDPALGKWGDGFLYYNGVNVSSKTIIDNLLNDDKIVIDERLSNSYGLKQALYFEENSVKSIEVANWRELGETDGEKIYHDKIYDLALEVISNEANLTTDSTFIFNMSIGLLDPNFGDTFVRADIPSEFSIENGLVFPQDPKMLFEIFNSSDNELTNAKTNVVIPYLDIDTKTYYGININSNSVGYSNLGFSIKELYEDVVIPIEVNISSNDVEKDSFIRNIFIPAPPISDTGLVVTIDSLIQNYPQMGFRFNVKDEESGSFLLSLRNQNLFLYENEKRINDFELMKDIATEGLNAIDVVFVLDVTGSMSNEINEVKSNIIEFAESLEQEGYSYNLGLVTFLDIVENVYPFTSDVHLFKSRIEDQQAHGGGDYTENSLDALMAASQMSFRESSNRIIIWITDANYHINNSITSLSVNDVNDALLLKGISAYCIGNPEEQTDFYEQITIPTGGGFFSILGNFRDILLDISKLKHSTDYILRYNSNLELSEINSLKLEVHYAGLGGNDEYIIQVPPGQNKNISTSCYPNPFNPITNISISKPESAEGVIEIFNILGQRVKSIPLSKGGTKITYQWNALSDSGKRLSSGVYILNVRIFDKGKLVNNNSIKMMLLK